MPLTPTRRCGIVRLASLSALLGALAAPAGAQTLALKNIPPGEILRYFSSGRGLALPAGVTKITARPQDNALEVVATPEGFRFVQEVAQQLDVPTRSVSLTVWFLRVSDATGAVLGVPVPLSAEPGDFRYVAPPAPGVVAAFLRSARPDQAQVTTTSDVPTSLTLPAPGVRSVALTLTPRVNADGTVTLTTHQEVAEEFSGSVGAGVAAAAPTLTEDTTRTVHNGEPIVYTQRLFDAEGAVPNNLLIIVTPTVLDAAPPATPRP